MRHKPVADGEHGVSRRRLADRHAFLHRTDDNAADDVDENDEKPRDRVAAHEFRRAVHGAKEIAFLLQLLAPQLGFILCDKPAGKIGIDRHLLSGHGVKAEPRRDFRDPSRTLGNNHEINDDKDGEHNAADDIASGDDEAAERLDNMARRVRARVPLAQNQARRGDVEAKAQRGRNQKHGRKG